MGKKKGKGKSQGQSASGDQPQQGEGATGGPSTPRQQPEAPRPQTQQPEPQPQRQPQQQQQQRQPQQQQQRQPQQQQQQQQQPQQQQQQPQQQQQQPQQQQQQRQQQQQQQQRQPQQHQRQPQQQQQQQPQRQPQPQPQQQPQYQQQPQQQPPYQQQPQYQQHQPQYQQQPQQQQPQYQQQPQQQQQQRQQQPRPQHFQQRPRPQFASRQPSPQPQFPPQQAQQQPWGGRGWGAPRQQPPPQGGPPGFQPPPGMVPPGFQQQQQQGPPQMAQAPMGARGPAPWGRQGQPQVQPSPGTYPQQQQQLPPTQQPQQVRAPPQQQQQQPQQQQQQALTPRAQQQPRGPPEMPPEEAAATAPQGAVSRTPRLPPQGAAVARAAAPPGGQGDRLSRQSPIVPGTNCRKIIKVESNHLSLDVGKLMSAVHYDVAITPDTPKALLRDVMNIFGQKHYPKRFPAFDGRKNLYSPTKLDFGPTDSISDTIKVEGENRTKEFKVEIKFARMVDLSPLHDMLRSKQSPQDALQCLDIVLRNAPSNRCITAGRCFFTPPRDQILSLGDGMEMYYGFYQSAIRGWKKPLLNVDVAHKAFPSALNVLELACELGSDYRYKMPMADLSRPIREDLQSALEKFLKQLKVKYEITGQSGSKRIYRVNGLGEPASRAKFKLENGQTTTVERYFQDVKHAKLRYPHLPTLWVGSRDRESKILVPLEFCQVVSGQAINRKMNENQTSAMIKNSATSTEIRKRKIMKSLDEVRYNEDPCIREFGFSVGPQFEKLDARVLTPPNLTYANNSKVTPSRGVWRSDRNRFFQGAAINKWTIVAATRYPPKELNMLAEQVAKMAPLAGMNMGSKATPPFQQIGGRQTVRDFVDYFNTKRDFDLIFVVVPNSGQIYSYVKQAAELSVGCLTQCIKERTLSRLNPQTVGNILLKINSKLNGTNHIMSDRPPIMNRPCMIMGADVTHPSPDAKDIPSVAAVTASHEAKAFQYNICWRLQPPKVEIIEDLCQITKDQLMFFYQRNKCKPERIIFFRDGVSEGQFREVMNAEILAIQNACKILQKDGYEPKITFLVVQKRHHTRLFPTNPRDSEDKNMNVPAGTCVDTTITNPMMQDFYLVSHASIQGVAKPTKYCTLWDDNNMSNDDIEQLTYYLCHMFTRCNRSVSYPAPTYYAHLAAARAKVYIENDKLNMDELSKHQLSYQIKECISKDKPMFFV